jgi:hypothetical protein
MVSHCGERAHFPKRTAHRPMRAGICRPGAVHRESFRNKREQRPPRQAACAARGERDGICALSRVMGQAPMRDVDGIERDFDWPRGAVPKRGIAAAEVER